MKNLALQKPALQSSVSEWSARRDPVLDANGGNNGRITGQQGFHTDTEDSPWWQVDLGDECLIHEVRLYNRQHCAHRLRHFSVLVSPDGETWRVVFRKRDEAVFGAGDLRPYVVGLPDRVLARFLRIRLDGRDALHFDECEVYGERPDDEARRRLLSDAARQEAARRQPPECRRGDIVELDDFLIFVDADNYDYFIIEALKSGRYEDRERRLVAKFLQTTDRVIEVGTALGAVTMTAAAIIGPQNVLTFDANPAIVADAQANFRRNSLASVKTRVGLLRNRAAMTDAGEFVAFYIARQFWGSRLDAAETDPDIVGKVTVPVFCLEDEIERHDANVLICDIEGGEVALLAGADLRRIRLIILETHYWAVGEAATDAMMRGLAIDGFAIHLGESSSHVTVLRRHEPS